MRFEEAHPPKGQRSFLMFESNANLSQKILAAEWYLNLGWSLIPILPQEKRPPHGFGWSYYQYYQPTKSAVHQWIRHGWYLAVVTGPISNLVVIDDDRIKNGLPEWQGLTSSIISVSEHFGKHYFFLYDKELHQANNQTLRLDIKAYHNYCLIPPFGNRYWISKPTKENLAKLKPTPEELVRLILQKPRKTLSHPPKPFFPKQRPTFIKGETWAERVERAKHAPLEIYIYPFLHQQTNIYGGISSLCPFHKENTPSFELKYPVGEQTDFHGHCYGCNRHVIGVIAFHMERTNLEFNSAIRDLTK